MSRRGEITVKCDVKGCEAEQHFTAKELEGRTLCQAKYAAGWLWWNDHDICPQCDKERESAAAR